MSVKRDTADALARMAQQIDSLRDARRNMRAGLQFREANWLEIAKTQAAAGHYREAMEAQLFAEEVRHVLDQWCREVEP